MYLCYIDESGTPDIPGNTSHFVLVGIAIPIDMWKTYEMAISKIKSRYDLAESEIHTGWLARSYLEQSKIPRFENLDRTARRSAVLRERNKEILHLQKVGKPSAYKQTKKNFKSTEAYIHLTRKEREEFLREIVAEVGSWDKARLFAECVDKLYFDPVKTKRDVSAQAFEQIVSRFEQFLSNKSLDCGQEYGMLIHDNNDTVALKHTQMMKQFHNQGTFWVSIGHIIETPLFVDSELTSMIQIADICGYALRRYVENDDRKLFEIIFPLGDRKPNGKCVGIRHYTTPACGCDICRNH
jgi:hypothetical protein